MASTAKVVFEVPTPLADELAAATQGFLTSLLQRGLREERVERVLEQYQLGEMSFAAAAEKVGISQSELALQAYVRGIEPRYDPEMVAEELA